MVAEEGRLGGRAIVAETLLWRRWMAHAGRFAQIVRESVGCGIGCLRDR
jgi:hypothetical protein